MFDFGGGGDGGPEGGLIQTPDGDFHGTTDGGGIGHGSVFTITPSGIESGLYFFGDVSGDGWIPQAGLIQGTDGNLYGTTNEGGPGGGGTVFDITPAGVETVLYSFTAGSVDGDAPKASLIQGSDGDFYGTTELGGTNDAGTVFKVVPLQ